MTSKKSFLASIKTNARRRVWLFVIMFLFFFFYLPVVAAMGMNGEKMYYQYADLSTHLGKWFGEYIGLNGFVAVLIGGLAILSAVQGFSYMYRKKKLDFYMSVPVSKGSRFAAIYLNGIFVYLFSYLFHLLLGFALAQAMGADTSLAVSDAATAFIGYSFLYLAVYHTAILAVMLTGNMIVTLMGTTVMLFYDGTVFLLLQGYMSTFFNSYTYRTDEALSKIIISPVLRFFQMLEKAVSYKGYPYGRVLDMRAFWLGLLPVIAGSIIILALAYWCYVKKPSEACGKSMAFPCTKAVIKVLLTALAGLAGGLTFYCLSGNNIVFCIFGLLAGTLLCHGVIEVIYDFDIRSVKNGCKSLLISSAAVGVFFSIFWFDMTGYDRYVPEADQVDHIAFRFSDEYFNYYDETMESVNAEEYIFDNMELTDIAPVLELAEKRMGYEPDEKDKAYRQCVVQYVLKNGKKIYRAFPVLYREDVALLDEIVGNAAYQQGSSPAYNDAVLALGNKLKVYYDNGSSRKEMTLSVEKLINAYRKDLEQLTFSQQMTQLAVGRIQLEYINEDIYANTSLTVYPFFANTIALLKEEGMYSPTYLDTSRIERIIVNNSNSTLYENGEDMYNGYDRHAAATPYIDYSVEASFENPQEIQQIAEGVYPSSLMEGWLPDGLVDTDYYVTVVYRQGMDEMDNYSAVYYMLEDKIPDFVKERTVYTGENGSMKK